MKPDLRATQQILTLLESTKSVSDRIFEHFPGAFLILTESGRILLANSVVARHLDLDIEDVLGLEFRELFSASEWKSMSQDLKRLVSRQEKRIELELPLTDRQGKTWVYAWELILIQGRGQHHPPLIALIARDVSQLKQAMRKVIELDHQLELAKTAQTLLLPECHEVKGEGWALISYFEPMAHASGDWWAYDVRSDGTVILLVGDVSGHDAGAAMVTAMIAGSYRAMIAQDRSISTEDLLHGLNERLCDLPNSAYWMTMAGLEFGTKQNEVKWVSASAPPLLWVSADGRSELATMTVSTPLGSGPLKLAEGRLSFNPGDRLLVATDGLLDLMFDNLGETASVRKLSKILSETKDSLDSAKSEVEKIVRELRVRVRKQEMDDLAFIIVERRN